MMSPELFTLTASVSVQAGPSIPPRFVAFPDGDQRTASYPPAVKENPTLHPTSLRASATLWPPSPTSRSTVAFPDGDHSTASTPPLGVNEVPIHCPASLMATT